MLISDSSGKSDIYAQLSSPDVLESRAESLVAAGGAATLQGAKAILNTTIALIVDHNCKSHIA